MEQIAAASVVLVTCPKIKSQYKPKLNEHGININYAEISFYLFVSLKHVPVGEHCISEQVEIVCGCVRVL